MLVSEVLANIKDDDRLATYIAEIPKKYQKTQIQFLGALDRLAYLLYLKGSEDEAVYLLEKLAQIEYDGNYNYWGTVENTIVLLAFIKKDAKEYVLSLKSRIDKAINSGDEMVKAVKQKVHNRFLKGMLLASREDKVNNSKNEIDEIENRIILLGDLLRLYIFLETVTMQRSNIIKKIEFNLHCLRDFFKKNSMALL
ncbi:TPA: hypothetical protein QB352_002369, partial [Pasteurella multocida]|nr:hypothetical protein [Pasteurella multocida]